MDDGSKLDPEIKIQMLKETVKLLEQDLAEQQALVRQLRKAYKKCLRMQKTAYQEGYGAGMADARDEKNYYAS